MDSDDSLPLPRATPLSADDISEIRSLLDPSLPSVRPLRGRQVMVPITTKAFFAGTLRPATSPWMTEGPSTSADVAVPPEEERVLVNLDQGFLLDVTRGEAADMMDRRMEALTTKRRKDASTSSSSLPSQPQPQQPQTSADPAGSSEGTCVSSTDGSADNSKVGPLSKKGAVDESRLTQKLREDERDTTSLPFVDIREEYDERGNEVSARAYDVAEELDSLRREVKVKAAEVGTEGAGEIGKLFGDLKMGDENDDDGGENVVGLEGAEAMVTNVPAAGGRAAMGEKYEELSARLDQLARMEEEDERNKRLNLTSRQRIQGKAWGKGFLDGGGKKEKSATATSKERPTPKDWARPAIAENRVGSIGGVGVAAETEQRSDATRKKKESQSKGWSRGFLNKESAAKKGGKRAAEGTAPPQKGAARVAPPPAVEATEPKKKVAFGANDVREIPRIESRPFGKAVSSPSRGGSDTSRGMPKPFERDAFSGVVKERSAETIEVPVVRGQITDCPGTGGIGVSSSAQSNDQQPKKKLSRFAQQRQQLRS